MNKKYYYIYKLTNLVNDKIYVGKHITTNLDDGYMGSGKLVQLAEKKYGLDSFKKDIMCFCDSEEELNRKEAEIVNEEFLKRDDVYNLKLGGDGGWDHLKGKVLVKDKFKNTFQVSVNDPRYLSGELISIVKGLVNDKDEDGNAFQTSVNDPRYLSGELVGVTKGLVTVKDKSGNTFKVSIDDPRYLSGELVGVTKGLVNVKDRNGNTFQVSADDPRYLSGELVGVFSGRTHSESTKQKMKLSAKGKHQGKLNSQYGTMWIYNPELKQNKKICKSEYIPDGWLKGRKMNF